MKKIFLVGILMLAGVVVNAQNYDGKWFVSGAVRYDNIKNSQGTYGDRRTQLTFKPALGLFVTSTTALGVELSFEKFKTTTDNVESHLDFNSHSFGFAPFVKRYWGIYSKFSFVGQVSVPVSFGKNISTDSDLFGIGLDLTPGIAYKASNHFSIEAGYTLVGISYKKSKSDNGISTSSFSTWADTDHSLGNLTIGFKYIF